jgi:hypothetical protein
MSRVLFFFLLYSVTLVAQSVVVIQNNQQIRAGAISDSIRDREQQYWAQRIGFRIAKNNDYELYAVLRGLGAAAKNNNPSQLDSQTLTHIGQDSLNYYSDPTASPKVAGQDSATNALVAAASMENPWIGVASAPVLDIMSAHLASQISSLYPIDRDELRSRFLEEGNDGLKDLWAQADKDPRLKAAINGLIEKRYKGIALNDNAITSPDVDLQTYRAAVQALENSTLTPEEMRGALKTFTEAQSNKLDHLDKELRTFAAAKATQQQREENIKNFRAAIDDERAVFYLASTFAGIVDPTTGRVISGIGTAYTKIAETSGLYRLGQISSLRLTADVVSAGLLLTSMLGTSGPTADEMILEEIHKLSLQINTFRLEMHQRFDRVDQTLSRMYVDLIANFNEVNKNLARARQGIVALQVQLVKLQGELGELDRRVQSYSQGLSSQVASSDQLLCIPDSAGNFDNHLSVDQILACVLSFTNNGSATAKSAVWNNLSPVYSEETLQTELDRPIEQNVNFLWGLAASLFNLRPAPSFMVANPVVWAANSNNYVRLVSSSRPISARLGPTDELIRTGGEINAAIEALGRAQLSGTTQTLFDRLIPYFVYQMKRTDLDVAALEMAYQRQRVAGYDPWESTAQQKDSSTPDTWTFTTAPTATSLNVVPVLTACPDAKDVLAGAQLAAPKQLASWIPYTFRMAQELGLGQVNACYSTVQWGRVVQRDTLFSGSLSLEVRLTFSLNRLVPKNKKSRSKKEGLDSRVTLEQPKELMIARRSATSEAWSFDCRVEKTGGAFGGVSVANCSREHHHSCFSTRETAIALQQLWSSWQDKFVGSASGEIDTPADVARDLDAIRTKVATSLGNHRAAMRTEIIDAIKGQTGNPDFIAEEQTAVIKDFHMVQGTKSLIDAYAGLTLSHSIETDEALAAGLGSVSPANWAVELSRMGKRETKNPSSATHQASSRVLYPLSLTTRANQLQAVLDKRLRSGAEPYVLVETTLQNLQALRVVQIAQSLSAKHPCFANGSNVVIEGSTGVGSGQTLNYADADPLTSIRVSIVPLTNNSTSVKKIDVVIGNGELLMSGLIEDQSTSKGNSGKMIITFPANGMVFRELRKGIVRVCSEFSEENRGWSAESISVEVSKGGGTFETFRHWANVPFPAGLSSSVTFRGDRNVSDRTPIDPQH